MLLTLFGWLVLPSHCAAGAPHLTCGDLAGMIGRPDLVVIDVRSGGASAEAGVWNRSPITLRDSGILQTNKTLPATCSPLMIVESG